MSSNSSARSRRGRRLACGGCLIILAGVIGVMVCLGGVLAARAFGLFGPNAEQLYSGAPDPVASAAVESALLNAGLENAHAVVIPISGSDGQIAVITLDQAVDSRGANSPAAAFDAALQGMSAANQTGDFRIQRVTLDLRDEDGNPGLAMTAPQESVDAYAQGQISRAELMAGADVDVSSLIDPETFNALLEEAQ
jgi:hypothetical protein